MKLFVITLSFWCISQFSDSRPAYGHSFYPYECCSEQDCWPMGQDDDAREPDPKPVDGGYLTHDGIYVPHDETRQSPDGRFHVCRHGGRATGGIIEPSSRPICMWAPRPSS